MDYKKQKTWAWEGLGGENGILKLDYLSMLNLKLTPVGMEKKCDER